MWLARLRPLTCQTWMPEQAMGNLEYILKSKFWMIVSECLDNKCKLHWNEESNDSYKQNGGYMMIYCVRFLFQSIPWRGNGISQCKSLVSTGNMSLSVFIKFCDAVWWIGPIVSTNWYRNSTMKCNFLQTICLYASLIIWLFFFINIPLKWLFPNV